MNAETDQMLSILGQDRWADWYRLDVGHTGTGPMGILGQDRWAD